MPTELRGTYGVLGNPATVDYLKKLGITALELMPVHHFLNDHHLEERGLSNFWGYNSIGYFAPHHAYSSSGAVGQQVQEFKTMVRELHAAGIEVILDVVYNHSGEGNHMGPQLCWKGYDNASYYRLVGEDPRYYRDYTGTGNSFNMRNAHVLQMIMDSLRYWITEMHVDGFRFDLASTLARELHEVDRLATFFDLIQQDPICRAVKLIAEPWDLGEGGYQVGNFPPLWTEWNGKYRDCVRDYWRGADQTMPEMASRLTGSSDLYQSNGRRPYASINFITAHDGFSLADLVSYNEKHNEANGEENRDGESNNRSWNCGVECATDEPAVLAWRRRQQRTFLGRLFLSQGVPMMLAGDELGHTQRGNNNTYAQDSELSWIDWASTDVSLLEFTRKLIRLRREHPSFRRRRFLVGRRTDDSSDIHWYRPDGNEMSDDDWHLPFVKAMAVLLDGGTIRSRGEHGEPLRDDDFLLLFNAHHEPLRFALPKRLGTARVELSTEAGAREAIVTDDGLVVEGRSLVVVHYE